MLKGLTLVIALTLTCGLANAQNTNSSTTRPPTKVAPAKPAPAKAAPAATASSKTVVEAFNKLMDGIKHADVDEVTGIYWNDPRLNMFNYNGTVTKGWQQVRKNRESSYPEIKDVKLEVRDRSITMLGPDHALVTCQWTQSQNYKGSPETASGRMTLVFKRIGGDWKAIHLHSSPDTPNPAAIPPSEQRPAASPSPTP